MHTQIYLGRFGDTIKLGRFGNTAKHFFQFLTAATVVLTFLLLFFACTANAQEVLPVTQNPISAAGFLQAILPALLTALATVVTGVIAILGKALHSWLTEKAKTSALAGVALRVDTIGESVVAHVNAGMKAKLEELSADGELSKDDVVALKAEGLKLFKEALGEQGLTSITGALGIGAGLVDTFLSGVLEKKVEEAKAAVPQ